MSAPTEPTRKKAPGTKYRPPNTRTFVRGGKEITVLTGGDDKRFIVNRDHYTIRDVNQ